MAESRRITIRVHDKIYHAIEKEIAKENKQAAANSPEGCEPPRRDVTAWIRELIEDRLQMKFDMPRGLAAVSKAERRKISTQGVESRWGAESARHLKK